MALEKITVIAGGSGGAGGAVYEDWESVVIEADAAVGYINCLLTTTEVTPIGANTQSAFDKWAFPPGTPIEIYANGTPVCSVIVWQYVPTADASQHNITLYCKSQASDFSNSSIPSDSTGGNYENQTVRDIIGDWMQRMGLKWVHIGNNPSIPIWQLRQGATGFEEALRMIRSRGMMVFGLMNGSIAVSDGRAMGAQGPIVQGENIIQMTGRLTDMRFDMNLTIGQKNIGTSLKEDLQAHGEAAADTGSPLSKRLKTIVEPALVDNSAAATRSDWERRRAFGATTEVIVKVPGWHAPSGVSYIQDNVPTGQEAVSTGPLWRLMADTYIYAPWLKVDCVLRCVRLVFKQSIGEGSTTELTLQDPVAFLNMGGAPCNNGSVWAAGFNPMGQYMPGFEDDVWEQIMTHFGGGIGHM